MNYIFSICFVLLLSFLILLFKDKILSNNHNFEDDFEENNYQNFESKEYYEDKMDSSLIDERDRQNDLKEKLMTLLSSTDIHFNKDIIQEIDLWKNNTYPYLGIKRFAIPMIASVSAGKTSTLNYLLNLKDNLLETGEKITTKFCVIIRHNKNNKKGKIFNVTVEKRGEINKFNFIKQEEIKQDPKKFIEERNELIKNHKKEEKDLGLYFIILEIDTGLFEGEYEKYAELIEFIDIPGLDEKGLEDNFIFRNILPFIKPNILFPIIIIDALKFESSNIFKALSEAFNPYLSKNINKNKKILYDLEIQNYALNISKNNSMFIMNKLNLCLKQEKHNIMNRIITVVSERLNVSLEFHKNIYIINALAKSIEVNKYQSFLNYINYTINKEEIKEDTEIINILSEELKKDFQYNIQINLNEKIKNYKSSGSKKEYEIFDKMIKEKKLRKGKFSEKYFYYFSNAFIYLKNKKKSSLNFDSDGSSIKNAIKHKIQTLINEFLDQKSLNQIFKLLKIDINDLEKELLLKSSKKVINNPMELIKALYQKILKLKELENGNEGINELNNDFLDLIHFMNNNQFLHYLMSGPYSSGKSFTLNNIIGYNLYLLETGTAETTNHAFIIRYNKNISLYKAKLVKTKYQFFFEKEEKLAEGENLVRKRISEENHNTKEFSIYILETPIEIFEDIKVNDELRNKVEFIDFPGLNTEKAIKLNYINNQIFKIINGFFFLNEPKDIGTNDVDDLFKLIMKKLVLDDSNIYNLKNSLILFTKNKKEGNEFYNKDLIDKINENLIKSLKDDLELMDIETIKSKLNSARMNYAKLSNINYKNYMDFKNKTKTFKDFINYIINALSNPYDIKSLLEDIDMFIKEKFEVEKKQNSLLLEIISAFFKPGKDSQQKNKYDDITLNKYNNYIEDFIQIINEKNLKGKKFTIGINEKYKILDYVKKYLDIKDNIKNFTDYNKSYYEDFKLKFKEIIVSSDDTRNMIFNEYLFENIIKTISVIQIINSKFLMNEEEFKKKYNENENERYIKNLEEQYKIQCSLKDAKILNLEDSINIQIDNVENAEESKAKKFRTEFENIKEEIDKIFINKYNEILEVYNTIKLYIFKSIKELNSIQKDRDKFDIRVEDKIFKKKEFKKEVSITIYGFLKNLFHNYEDDIKNVKKEYNNLIKSYLKEIKNDINNKFEELKGNGKKTIDLIFKTAISNINNLKKNSEKYRELSKEIENLILMNFN